jgi:hypothetical protein
LTTSLSVMEERLNDWFWTAEDRHQKHEERRRNANADANRAETATLTISEWLAEYGRREKPIFGSAQTINQSIEAE